MNAKDCGFILGVNVTETPPTHCPNCLNNGNLTGSDENAEKFYETLNNPSSIQEFIDEQMLLPMDLLHDACNCPTFDPNTPTNIYTTCEYTTDWIEQDRLAPICLICNGCYLCRIDQSDTEYA